MQPFFANRNNFADVIGAFKVAHRHPVTLFKAQNFFHMFHVIARNNRFIFAWINVFGIKSVQFIYLPDKNSKIHIYYSNIFLPYNQAIFTILFNFHFFKIIF